MSWEFVSRELRELLDICDEQEAFLVSFDLMKDVPVAHIEKNYELTGMYLEWDFNERNWKIIRIC